MRIKVTKFGETRLCYVYTRGEPQTEYPDDKILWVGRPEDWYKVVHYKEPFCILRRYYFINGKLINKEVE